MREEGKQRKCEIDIEKEKQEGFVQEGMKVRKEADCLCSTEVCIEERKSIKTKKNKIFAKTSWIRQRSITVFTSDRQLGCTFT